MVTNYGTGRKISETCFTHTLPDGQVYVCKCGVSRKRTGTSYSNLVSHVKKAHPEYHKVVNPDGTLCQSEMTNFFVSTKAANIHGWLDLFVSALLPFSIVGNRAFRSNVKPDYVSVPTIMSYLQSLTQKVEQKLEDILPSKLALVFDGWTHGSFHFIAVFASYTYDNSQGFTTRLLALSPLNDESHLNSEEHIEFSAFVLNLFGKS